MPAVGASREHGDLLRISGGPEILIAQRSGGDVERRGVDADAGRRGDRLTVHVGHRRLDPGVRGASFDRGERETQRQTASGIQRVYATRCRPHLRPCGVPFPLLPPPAVLAEVVAVQSRDIEAIRGARFDIQCPVDDGAGHRSAEEVPRLDVAVERVAVEARRAVGGDRDEKLRWPIFRHAVARARDILPGAAFDLQRDIVRTERQVVAEFQRLRRGTERGEAHDRVAHNAAFPILEHPAHRIAGGRDAQRAQCAVADDCLHVDRFAGTIDAALGEHGGRHRKPVRAPRRADIEAPRREITGPRIDRHDRPIERQAGGDIARKPALHVTAVFTGVA